MLGFTRIWKTWRKMETTKTSLILVRFHWFRSTKGMGVEPLLEFFAGALSLVPFNPTYVLQPLNNHRNPLKNHFNI